MLAPVSGYEAGASLRRQKGPLVIENYDSLWLYNPPQLTTHSNTFYYQYRYPMPIDQVAVVADGIFNFQPPEETPVPAAKTKQQEIDDAVREALEKPKREAEIAKRIAAVEKLTALTFEIGTVVKWKRQHGKNDYTYAAIKATEDKWFVTGSNMVSVEGRTWEKLIEWMTTGENLIHDLQVSGEWTTVL